MLCSDSLRRMWVAARPFHSRRKLQWRQEIARFVYESGIPMAIEMGTIWGTLLSDKATSSRERDPTMAISQASRWLCRFLGYLHYSCWTYISRFGDTWRVSDFDFKQSQLLYINMKSTCSKLRVFVFLHPRISKLFDWLTFDFFAFLSLR